MNLYVVKYWQSFPQSEYGGIQGYVASSRNKLHKMIVADIEESGYYYTPDDSSIQDIVMDAKIFPLSDNMAPGKQFEFTT